MPVVQTGALVNVTVCVATFGSWDWAERARPAILSAEPQADVVAVHRADGTLAAARNEAAGRAAGDWLIFLDADDRLAAGYVDAMATAVATVEWPEVVLWQPATRGLHPDGRLDDEANIIPPGHHSPLFPAPLLERNHLVIGTMVDRYLFHRVGGFADLPCLEDWDLWLRCWIAGATWRPVPAAEYLVGVNPGSRNMGDPRIAGRVAADIRRRYEPAARAAGLLG